MHCKSYSHFFSKKFQHICVSLDVNFNESLTNDVVSFEQLGPGMRSAMCAASQLSGRGATDVDVGIMLPLYLHVNQKSGYDMISIDTGVAAFYKYIDVQFVHQFF